MSIAYPTTRPVPCATPLAYHTASPSHVDQARVAATGRVGGLVGLGEPLEMHVIEREVVHRVVGHFPDEQRVPRVGDDLASQVRTHSLASPFDLHPLTLLHADLRSLALHPRARRLTATWPGPWNRPRPRVERVLLREPRQL